MNLAFGQGRCYFAHDYTKVMKFRNQMAKRDSLQITRNILPSSTTDITDIVKRSVEPIIHRSVLSFHLFHPPPHPIHQLITSHKLCFENRGGTGVINRPKRYSTMKGRSAGRRKNSAGSVFGHVIGVHSNKKTTKSLWNERRRCRWKGCSLSTAR